MRKTTIFYGPRDSGKTIEARKLLTNGVQINHTYRYSFMYNAVKPETKELLFDDVRNIDMIKLIIRTDFIEVEKQGLAPQLLPTPDLIFTVPSEFVSLADIEKCLLGPYHVTLVRTNSERNDCEVIDSIDWLKKFMIRNRYFIGNDLNKALDEAEHLKNIEVKSAYLAGCEMGEMHNNENRCYETDAVEYLKTKTK